MMKGWITAILSAALVAGVGHAGAVDRKTPYWASLSAGQARMRSGPGRNYPATWLYQRKGLPVQVVEVYPGWRKVRDPDGVEGWMIGNLISDQRTAVVRGAAAGLRADPRPDSPIRWRAQPGVVGRVSHCAAGWCRLDVDGRGGFVEQKALWGVDPDETLD